jgi:radical SAM protein with 4Fe4S-binding SPASM domain
MAVENRESRTEDRVSEKPRLIAFEVTRRCQFNCLHCRANAGASKQQELTTEQCKKILASVADFIGTSAKRTRSSAKKTEAAKDGCVIILTGGEPMERDDIYELIRYGHQLGLRMVMATCGYLIDDESIAKLKEAGVMVLSFSLDGSGAETHDKIRQAEGAFDAAIKAAEIARRAGMPFQINTTISKINVDEVAGIVELAKRLGAQCFNPFILVPTGRGAEMADAILDPVQYEVLLNELLGLKLEAGIEVRVTCGPQFARVCEQARAKKLIDSVSGCMGGRGFGFISYCGDVQTCGFLDISAGNLIENGFDFANIWRESEFLNEIRDPSNYKGACRICDYLNVCGGCRARAYAICGDYLAADPICKHQAGKVEN